MNHNKNYIRETYPEILTDRYSDYGQGWVPHVNKITDYLVEKVNGYNENTGRDVKLEIQQIKQKFGGLRYYFTLHNTEEGSSQFYDDLQQYVHNMESICSFICEVCGKYGEKRRTGWTQTLCDEHYEEYIETHGGEDG